MAGFAMEMRELKALEIAARMRIVFEGGVWIVPSQSSGKAYKVRLGEEPSCECQDFELTGRPCKHIIAAKLVCERDHGGKAPEIDTDALPEKKKYAQNWAVYDQAQTQEKDRFQVLLAELCQGIEDP